MGTCGPSRTLTLRCQCTKSVSNWYIFRRLGNPYIRFNAGHIVWPGQTKAKKVINPASTTVQIESHIQRLIKYYTMLALATGALPFPAASTVIVAQNATMIAQIASRTGIPISLTTVTTAMGLMGTVNVLGKTLFMEVAKSLSWGATGGLATLALSMSGATTAALQTYVIGHLAYEIARWNGEVPRDVVKNTIATAKAAFGNDLRQWRAERCPT